MDSKDRDKYTDPSLAGTTDQSESENGLPAVGSKDGENSAELMEAMDQMKDDHSADSAGGKESVSNDLKVIIGRPVDCQNGDAVMTRVTSLDVEATQNESITDEINIPKTTPSESNRNLVSEEQDETLVARSIVKQAVTGALTTLSKVKNEEKPNSKRESSSKVPTLEERVDTFIAEQQKSDKRKTSAKAEEVGSRGGGTEKTGSHAQEEQVLEALPCNDDQVAATEELNCQSTPECISSTQTGYSPGDPKVQPIEINNNEDDKHEEVPPADKQALLEEDCNGEEDLHPPEASEHGGSTMDELARQVLDGSRPLHSLPPISKKVVRIFVSSTFSDTKEERNAFMEHVYPKVAKLCRDKFGLEFQVVDMRWGVPEQASDNHSTTELCIQEIRKCQQVSVGPNFVAILGNKYGYRPMPSTISVEEFHMFAQIASSTEDSRWRTVEEWYMRDDNSIPPVYVLQAVSAKLRDYNNMENAELRKAARNEWNTIDQTLTETLRDLSMMAYEAGQLSSDAKHKYFMSVTENEVHQGIVDTHQQTGDTSLCIMRSIPDIDRFITETKAPKFIDVCQDSVDSEAVENLETLKKRKVPDALSDGNIINITIDWCASGGNISLESVKDKEVIDYAGKFAEGSKELNIVQHKKYLDKLCEDFFNRLIKMVNAGGVKNKQVYDDVFSESLQHLHFAKQRAEVFEGREDVLKAVKSYLNSGANRPIAIFGNSGCGKTSVMAKIIDKMKEWTKHASGNHREIVCILRFLGTTPATSNVQDLLTSLCKQISKVYGKLWEEPDRFPNLVKSFHQVLTHATKEKPLLILLDSIDQLLPSYDAFGLKWLPKELPPYVKMILSTIDEGYPIKDRLVDMYQPSKAASFIQIQPLGDKVGMTIITKWLNQQKRCITQEQQEIVLRALAQCSLPLYARIAYNQISSWRSFDVLGDSDLERTIKGAINKLYQQMETKLGEKLVKHSLAMFTASRYGLSEVELEHLLSLDDELLNDVFNFWKPPIRRVPPLLWTRVRNEINNYVVERSADGILVMNWYHRQFIEATKERYLKDESFLGYIHQILADFFSGKWGGGTEKPFEYTKAQMSRFGFQNFKSQADRKVPVQPFRFVGSADGTSELRFNERKISELPWHLLKAKQNENLLRSVFFNYDWLYTKLKATSATAIIQEIELLTSNDDSLSNNKELRILEATLQLIRPYITKYPESLPIELLGRLCCHIGSRPLLTDLVSQCDRNSTYCHILPLVTCYQTADLGLRQNINIRSTTPLEDSGGLTCSSNFKTMYVVDYDELGKGILCTFDIESNEKVSEFPIQKEASEGVMDYFLDCRMTLDDRHLLVFYRLKYSRGIKQSEEKYNWKAFSSEGFIDVVDITNGVVVRTLKEYLYKDDFYNMVLYQTKNWIAVRFGWKVPMLHLYESTSKSLTECHCLTKDEAVLALIRTKKDSLCKPTAEEEGKVKARSKTTVVRDFKTKELLAELDRSDDMSGITITNDDKIAILADFRGKLLMYGIKRIGTGKRNVKKIIGTLTLPFYEKINVFGGRHNYKRVALQMSPNDQFVYAVYQGREGWEAFLWDINTGKYVGRVTNVMPLKARYPIFSFDSACLVVCLESKVQLYSCLSACKAREYELGQSIRDIQVSSTSLDVAVLLSKDVVFIKAECSEKTESLGERKTKIEPSTTQSTVLMGREAFSGQQMHPAIVFDKTQGMASEDHSALDMEQLDRYNSARSQQRSPVDSSITPDGTVAVQLLPRLQVIDTQRDEIVFSPKTGDVILRPYTNAAGDVVNEEIPMPFLNGSGPNQRTVELKEGDRIVGEGHKVRYRCHGTTTAGQIKVMQVPSILTINGSMDKEFKRIHRITVYNESILTLSNNFLATTNKKQAMEFVNVYELQSGKLIATHQVDGGCTAQCFYDHDLKFAVTTKDLILRVFGDNGFVRCLGTYDLKPGIPHQSSRMATREIIAFPRNTKCLTIRMSEEGLQTYGVSYYMQIHLETKVLSPLLAVKPKLEDISKDGSIAVDSHLALYSLPKGMIIKQIPYFNANVNMQLQVRISDDNKHIVFVDKQDDTLHVVRLSALSFHHLVSCYTHTPHLSSIDGLYLRQHGMVVVLKGAGKLGLFVLCDSGDTSSKKRTCYEGELQRALSLVPEATQESVLSIDQATSTRGILSNGPVVQDFLSSLGSN